MSERFKYSDKFDQATNVDPEVGFGAYRSRLRALTGLCLTTAVLLIPSGCNNESDSSKYSEYRVEDAVGLDICDGAHLRQNPKVPGRLDGNIVADISFGNAPETTCVEVKTSDVYLIEDSYNGDWYGVPEGVIAKELEDTGLSENNLSNIIWVSQQKSKILIDENAGE